MGRGLGMEKRKGDVGETVNKWDYVWCHHLIVKTAFILPEGSIIRVCNTDHEIYLIARKPGEIWIACPSCVYGHSRSDETTLRKQPS